MFTTLALWSCQKSYR